MCLNQWANAVRWELRPRLLLRTTEFLWQEGHTVHATEGDAASYARRINADVYQSVFEDVLAIPVITGLKTASERFAGATATLTCEGMMRDGKALQLATSHELGQNFARAFDITYTDQHGARQHGWTTSWGSTTRMLGGMIMCHGDDAGLRLPATVAPVQVAVICVKDAPEVAQLAERIERELSDRRIRVRIDRRTDVGLGRRLTDWELKGVPVRIEIGPRDLAEGNVSLVRRDRREREPVSTDAAVHAASAAVPASQRALLDEARVALSDRTVDVHDVDAAAEAAQDGLARLPWELCGPEGEQRLNRAGVSIRCVTRPDGSIPDSLDDVDLLAIAARAY
jgi:prolyl-tRNA synthetase